MTMKHFFFLSPKSGHKTGQDVFDRMLACDNELACG